MTTFRHTFTLLTLALLAACGPKAKNASVTPIVSPTAVRDFPETELDLGATNIVYFRDGITPSEMAGVMRASGQVDALRLERLSIAADSEIVKVQSIRALAARVKEIDKELAQLPFDRAQTEADAAKDIEALNAEAQTFQTEKQTAAADKARLEGEKAVTVDPARIAEIEAALAQIEVRLTDLEASLQRNAKEVKRRIRTRDNALNGFVAKENELKAERDLKQTDQSLLLAADEEIVVDKDGKLVVDEELKNHPENRIVMFTASEKQRIWQKAVRLDAIPDLILGRLQEVQKGALGDVRKDAKVKFQLTPEGRLADSSQIAGFDLATTEVARVNCAVTLNANNSCRIEALRDDGIVYEAHGGKLWLRVLPGDGSIYEVRAERALYDVGEKMGRKIFTGDIRVIPYAGAPQSAVRKGLLKLLDKDFEAR